MKIQRFSASKDRLAAGFTLVELLVVIVIIAVLVSLILPAINAVRESARRLQCANNMKQLGIGVQGHVATWNYLPPATSGLKDEGESDEVCREKRDNRADLDFPPRHNVINFILPYLDQAVVYDKLDLREDWHDTEYTDNLTAARVTLPLLVCPSAPGGRKYVSDYAACTHIEKESSEGVGALVQAGMVNDRGPNGDPRWDGALIRRHRCFDPDGTTGPASKQLVTYHTTTAHIRDGMSTTMLLVEDGGRHAYDFDDKVGSPNGEWASHKAYFPHNKNCYTSQLMNCSNFDEIYSFHPGGAVFLFADGAVHYLSESMDPEAFVSYFTRAGEDDAPDFE